MDRIAFILGETFLYWGSLVMTLAVLTAVCVFLSLYLSKSGNGTAAAVVIPIALVLSLVLGRYQHWYCRADSYESFFSAMTSLFTGGYALMGAFAGCFLAAVLLRLTKCSENLPEMLDAMALAGGAGIALGRLACFFSAADRGQIVNATGLPWAYPVVNAVSGNLEYRLATFVIQAMVTTLIFLVVLGLYLANRNKDHWKDGDACLLFLLCYGASQVVLDSTRYDSLFFRSNGFVSIVQVLGALAIGLAAVLLSIRMVKARGWRWSYLLLWLCQAALVGGAGYMEYHVQRHGDQAAFAYTVMSLCLTVLMVLIFRVWALAVAGEKEKLAAYEADDGM